MRGIAATAGTLIALTLALSLAPAGEGLIEDGSRLGPELLPQGNFEKAKKNAKTPEGWDDVDDLTSFYVDRPDGNGKCLKFDSDVYDKEARARREEMKLPRDKRPPAKPKTPTTGPKYDTVAGGSGALLWSDYADVEPGATYRLVAEVNTYAPEVKIFIKGYMTHRGERRIAYKKYLKCKPEDEGELGKWKYYSTDFTPGNPYNKRIKIEWVKVMIMVFWPPGEAYVDNVSIKKIVKPGGDEEKKKKGKGG